MWDEFSDFFAFHFIDQQNRHEDRQVFDGKYSFALSLVIFCLPPLAAG